MVWLLYAGGYCLVTLIGMILLKLFGFFIFRRLVSSDTYDSYDIFFSFDEMVKEAVNSNDELDVIMNSFILGIIFCLWWLLIIIAIAVLIITVIIRYGAYLPLKKLFNLINKWFERIEEKEKQRKEER